MTRSPGSSRLVLHFSPIKFLLALCASEDDGEDKEAASCVVSLQEMECGSGPSPEDLNPGRSLEKRIWPGCSFASGAGRAVFLVP